MVRNAVRPRIVHRALVLRMADEISAHHLEHSRGPTLCSNDYACPPGDRRNDSIDSRQLPAPSPGETRMTALRNLRMMRLLEHIALEFQEAQVALLVLKGAALNATVYRFPDERLMTDLDLMIHPQDAGRAGALLAQMGGVRGEAQVREDFFPHFHYELEYRIGRVDPVKIDLHVRPFRPLRYANLVPADAFWSRAKPVWFGRATLWIPSPEDMLIHLMVHAAVHAFSDAKWLEDIRRWLVYPDWSIEWVNVLQSVNEWGLRAPFRAAGLQLEKECGPVLSNEVRDSINRMRCGRRDRLTLWHASRDAAHPLGHVLVNAICTPGFRFVLAYLLRIAFPSKVCMANWYPRRHWGWLPAAHLFRWLRPVIGRVPGGH